MEPLEAYKEWGGGGDWLWNQRPVEETEPHTLHASHCTQGLVSSPTNTYTWGPPAPSENSVRSPVNLFCKQ